MVDILADECLKALNKNHSVLILVWRQKCRGCSSHKPIMIPALLQFRKEHHPELVVGNFECTEFLRTQCHVFKVPCLLYLPIGILHTIPIPSNVLPKPIQLGTFSSTTQQALTFLQTLSIETSKQIVVDDEISQIIRDSLPPIIPLNALSPRDILLLPSTAVQLIEFNENKKEEKENKEQPTKPPSYELVIEIENSKALFLLNEFHDVALLVYKHNCGMCEFVKPIWMLAFKEFRSAHPSVICGMMESQVDDLLLAKHNLLAFPTLVYFKVGDLQKLPPFALQAFAQTKQEAHKSMMLDKLNKSYDIQGVLQTNFISDYKLKAVMKPFQKFIIPIVHFVTKPLSSGKKDSPSSNMQFSQTSLWSNVWNHLIHWSIGG